MFCLEQGRKRESSLSAQDSKELYQQSRQAIRASFGHMDKPHPNNRFVFIPGTCYPPPLLPLQENYPKLIISLSLLICFPTLYVKPST